MSTKKNVAILIFDDVEVLDFAGPFEVFTVASERIDPPPFYVYTVAFEDRPVKARGALTIQPHYTIHTAPTPDILVVPGGYGTRPLLERDDVTAWIRQQASQVDPLLSVCTGALLLAKAGLLKGLTATTHHEEFALFQSLDPTLTIAADRRFVDNGKIITAGGISAGIDMALHVVEKLCGAAGKAEVVKEMEYQWHMGR